VWIWCEITCWRQETFCVLTPRTLYRSFHQWRITVLYALLNCSEIGLNDASLQIPFPVTRHSIPVTCDSFQWRMIPFSDAWFSFTLESWIQLELEIGCIIFPLCRLRLWVISEWRSTSEQLLSWLLRCFKMTCDLSWDIWELASAEQERTTTRFERQSALHWPSLSEQWVAPWNPFFSEYQTRHCHQPVTKPTRDSVLHFYFRPKTRSHKNKIIISNNPQLTTSPISIFLLKQGEFNVDAFFS
jgi:hypothetical protein